MNACHTCSPGLIWIMANFDFVGLNVELRKQWVVIQSGSRPVPPPQDKKIFELAANERLQFSRMNLYTVKVKNHCCLVALYFHSGVTVLVLYFLAAGFVSRVVWTESLQLSTLTNALLTTLCISVLVTRPSQQAKIHRMVLYWICHFTLTYDDCCGNM